jgi:prophage maintenance system killer protein
LVEIRRDKGLDRVGFLVKYPEFEELVEFNKKAVLLTEEYHLYEPDDEVKLRSLLIEAENKFNDLTEEEQISWKASYLIYGISAGQHFYEGNKRTALITGAAFLKINGYTINIEDKRLLQVLDKCAILTATLKELYIEIKRLIKND